MFQCSLEAVGKVGDFKVHLCYSAVCAVERTPSTLILATSVLIFWAWYVRFQKTEHVNSKFIFKLLIYHVQSYSNVVIIFLL